MLIILPVLLLVVFGYAANFDVSKIPTVVVGPEAELVASHLPPPFEVVEIEPTAGKTFAQSRLRDGDAAVGLVTSGSKVLALLDGTQFFFVDAAENAFAHLAQVSKERGTPVPSVSTQILYDPHLKTSWIMIPGLTGLILLIVGTLITSLGIVRERQAGTIEQLAVMPFRPWDVIIGKIVPYLILASIDLVVIVFIGLLLFGVPFAGSVATFALGAVLFLMVMLGMGVFISTVSQNQGQAVQLALMFVIPQVLLSGLIFPISLMATGVRWIAYILPLSYFIEVSRGVMLKATPITALWRPLAYLAVMATVVFGLAILRFRRDLAPRAHRSDKQKAAPEPVAA
jgi:ABC-2 type transport system permease protein